MAIDRDMSFLKKDERFKQMYESYNFKLLKSDKSEVEIYNECFIIHISENSLDGSCFYIYNYKKFTRTSIQDLIYVPKKRKIIKKFSELSENFNENEAHRFIFEFTFLIENFPGLFDCSHYYIYEKYFEKIHPNWSYWQLLLKKIEKEKKENILK